jgi:peptide/nickel transport system ATP-binding protein
LQNDHGLSYLFITHNISVVEYLAHEIAVMYLGRIVEQGKTDDILMSPAHPYTRALLAAVPSMDGKREPVRFSGDLPSPLDPPDGCPYQSRCPDRMPQCEKIYPGASRLDETHVVHCHLYSRMQGDGGMDESAVSRE